MADNYEEQAPAVEGLGIGEGEDMAPLTQVPRTSTYTFPGDVNKLGSSAQVMQEMQRQTIAGPQKRFEDLSEQTPEEISKLKESIYLRNLQGQRAAIPGKIEKTSSDIMQSKALGAIVDSMLKFFAVYQGGKQGMDMSKVDVKGSFDWDTLLRGKLSAAEEERRAIEGQQLETRQKLSDRIRMRGSAIEQKNRENQQQANQMYQEQQQLLQMRLQMTMRQEEESRRKAEGQEAVNTGNMGRLVQVVNAGINSDNTDREALNKYSTDLKAASKNPNAAAMAAANNRRAIDVIAREMGADPSVLEKSPELIPPFATMVDEKLAAKTKKAQGTLNYLAMSSAKSKKAPEDLETVWEEHNKPVQRVNPRLAPGSAEVGVTIELVSQSEAAKKLLKTMEDRYGTKGVIFGKGTDEGNALKQFRENNYSLKGIEDLRPTLDRIVNSLPITVPQKAGNVTEQQLQDRRTVVGPSGATKAVPPQENKSETSPVAGVVETPPSEELSKVDRNVWNIILSRNNNDVMAAGRVLGAQKDEKSRALYEKLVKSGTFVEK